MIMEEESNVMDGEKSEAEDLLLSDTEDAAPVENDMFLSIDYNARIVSKEEKYDVDDADNCDMHYVDKSHLVCRRESDSRLHTSTEDLNMSDEEQCYSALTSQAINLDEITNISAKTDESSFSTLNYSHTVFKDEYSADAEYLSDDEISSNFEENFFKDKQKLPPARRVAGLKAGSSVVLPAAQKTLNSLNIKNAFTKSLLIEENDIHDLYDEQESPLMTCLEFLKSEITDDCNTDAEDLSVGSLEDISEISKQNRNNCEGDCNKFNIPISITSLSSENVDGKGNRISCLGDSRRSSTAEFLTEDETINLDSLCNRGRKRLKKRNFLLVDKNEVADSSLTDEEELDLGKKN